MYIRTVKSRGREYVQLAHNFRNPETGAAKVLFNSGRKDKLDTEGLKRLINSISRYLDADDLTSLPISNLKDAPFEFVGAWNALSWFRILALTPRGIDELCKPLVAITSLAKSSGKDEKETL